MSVHPKVKKLLRTAQTYFPASVNLKYSAQFLYRSRLRKPFDQDFAALEFFVPPKGTMFLDVGANRGQSIMSMRLFHTDVPIVAFEPCAATFWRLQRYAASQPQVTLIHGGLSDEPGRFMLYTPVYGGYVFDGLASTLRAEAAGWLNPDRIYFFDPAKLSLQEEEITVQTLDSYGLRPSLMKLDVQGAEENVLRGSLTTIASYLPILIIEQSPNLSFDALLGPLGYASYHLEDNVLRPGAVGRNNALLVPEARKRDFTIPVL